MAKTTFYECFVQVLNKTPQQQHPLRGARVHLQGTAFMHTVNVCHTLLVAILNSIDKMNVVCACALKKISSSNTLQGEFGRRQMQ